MAAPSKKLYIGVLVAFLLFIPTGLLLYHFGPAMVEAWRWRHLGGPLEARSKFAGCVVTGDWGAESLLLDASGKVLRRWPTPEGCSVTVALDNENILFGGNGDVWEVDRDGREVWRLPESVSLGWVTAVRRLANGNTLVAMRLTQTSFVLEFTPAGKEVWRRKCDSYPQSVQRLRNGNTLIGFWDFGAVEVVPDGKEIWKYEAVDCASARRLSNGNTLIAASPAVVEVDRAGQVVWEHKCQWMVSAERLPDGRTLISSSSRQRIRSLPLPPVRVLLVSPDGKEEVLYKGPGDRASAVYE